MKKSALLLPAALLALAGWAASFSGCQTHQPTAAFTPVIPRIWDDAVMATLNVPLANPAASARQISSNYYYRIPVRPIFKSYPIYHPDHQPPGYLESLRQLEPQEVWDASKLKTQADWERAGEIVFDAPIEFDDAPFAHIPAASLIATLVTNRLFYEQTGIPITRDGVMPYARYVIRTKGRIEVGGLSCAMCHTRLMADGSVIKGAQGNFPFDRVIASSVRDAEMPPALFAAGPQIGAMLSDAPWVSPPPMAQLAQAFGVAGPAAVFGAIPPGVLARHGTSLLSPVRVPDLIGVRERRYLDSTGLQRHRGLADLMRYAALNQDADLLAQYDRFRPIELLIPGGKLPEDPAAPEARLFRYSDEQLYALALYLYSRKPPPNPNLPKTAAQKALVNRGKEIFMDSDNRCATCHKPPLYTNNKLTPARGFKVPDNHPEGTNIMSRSVGTDPTLATQTRRGTGFYKVPSLLGVWYRGPFEHNGSCATLEEWFNPARTNDTYVPTGWKGPPGTKTRAVKGHEFGLDLSEDERKALIAFLKTL